MYLIISSNLRSSLANACIFGNAKDQLRKLANERLMELRRLYKSEQVPLNNDWDVASCAVGTGWIKFEFKETL